MTYKELLAILERAGKRGVHLYGAGTGSSTGTHKLGTKGTQLRTVRRTIEGKKVRGQEPVDKQHSLALIDGNLQVVKT